MVSQQNKVSDHNIGSAVVSLKLQILLLGLLTAVFPFYSNAQDFRDDGETDERFAKHVLIMNENEHGTRDAGIRLHTKSGSNYRHWTMFAEADNGQLYWGYFDSTVTNNTGISHYSAMLGKTGGFRVFDDGDINKYVQIGHTGTNSYWDHVGGSGMLEFRFGGTGKAQINTNGYIGIGGDFNPSAPLHVKTTGNKDFLSFETTDNNKWLGLSIKNNKRIWGIVNDANGNFVLKDRTGNKQRFYVDGANGHVSMSDGQDIHITLGKAKIGYIGHSSWAGFAHKGSASTTGYALLQNSSGATLLNAAASQNISFKISNQLKMNLDQYGNLGIGIGTPSEKLHLYDGDFKIERSSDEITLGIDSLTGKTFLNTGVQTLRVSTSKDEIAEFATSKSSATTAGISIMGARNSCAGCDMSYLAFKNYDSDGEGDTTVIARILSGRNNASDNKDGFIHFQTDSAGTLKTAMTIDDEQNVAFAGSIMSEVNIGKSGQNYDLRVHGAARVKGLYVDKTGIWADHVFADDYKLRSLEEVDKYIDENKHLPEVPSAEEVAQRGYDQLKMNATLLQKIEELTLYVIEQNQEIAELKSELKSMKK